MADFKHVIESPNISLLHAQESEFSNFLHDTESKILITYHSYSPTYIAMLLNEKVLTTPTGKVLTYGRT